MPDAMNSLDKVEIQDLLARYCHSIDRNDRAGWANCFTQNAVFEIVGVAQFKGESLQQLPQRIHDAGKGHFRHRIANVACRAGESPAGAIVTAYGDLSDWSDGGKVINFNEYDIAAIKSEGEWKIKTLVVKPLAKPSIGPADG